ncbi:GDP-fucose protein O-fucosyltransferase 2-like [Saccostrea echinata]|uniref:GDP-fucose protein O-fucosyltransferase 2-like n=1 Tax=Saccostrea echinata TaxID=191078 RepID=UPI002A82EC8F|nr:GDP-fucose protein O-fucosyltransferase 2-like [Saccostrea echinata]
MRVANLVYLMNQEEPWVLVLPPWNRMWHWRSRDVEQERLKWSTFFDIESLGKHVPVIEFEDYLKRNQVIDEVFYLQGVKEITDWETIKIDKCQTDTRFLQDSDGKWRHLYLGFEDLYAEMFNCLSFFGQLDLMKSFLIGNTTGKFIFLPRAENLLHADYGEHNPLFWKARRSMMYAKPLRDVGDLFRKKHLDSEDEADKTILKDWTTVTRDSRKATGGPFIAVHLRRGDHLHVRGRELPSMKQAAKHVKKLLKKMTLKKVFVATDGTNTEYEEFKSHLKDFQVYRFEPTAEELQTYKDGGVAIIDQWIACHARYFIGSSASTVSFRIREDREILGFEPSTSFNRFCGDDESDCEQPAHWTIVY